MKSNIQRPTSAEQALDSIRLRETATAAVRIRMAIFHALDSLDIIAMDLRVRAGIWEAEVSGAWHRVPAMLARPSSYRNVYGVA